MKALIFEDKVVDIVENEFGVSSAMKWMDAPKGCIAGEWLLVDGVIVAPSGPPELTYADKRASAYASVGDQLDQIMKDMKNGTTTHQTACEAVKTQFPKG
jgi:nucleotidyltransferase/DNA polymerase involved in DNA repair